MTSNPEVLQAEPVRAITSGGLTIRELMTTPAFLGPDPGRPVSMDGGPAEMNSLYG